MPQITQRMAVDFIKIHPEIATEQTMKVLNRLNGSGLIKKENLGKLMGIVRELGWERYIPEPNQTKIFEWLYRIKGLLTKLMLLKQLKIEPGAMVSFKNNGQSYRVKGIASDFSVTLEGRTGQWNPMSFAESE